MFRIGCCIPGGSFMPEGVGEVDSSTLGILKSGYETVMAAGFDYAEATVGLIMKLTDAEFDTAAALKSEGKLNFEVCNSFIPTNLPIYDTQMELLENYVERAMTRMTLLGADTVVFGSGKARSVPESSEKDAATAKIYDFIRMCEKKADKFGMTVALEPLNSRETNFLTGVSEGAELTRSLGLSHVKLLADAFHMACENEPAAVLSEVEPVLCHVHVSEADRSYPGKLDDGYLRGFACELKKSGYAGRVTCECSYGDFAAEAPVIFEFMKQVF